MTNINKKYIVLENQSGERVALECEKEFSSRIFFSRQIASSGGLDFTQLSDRSIKKSELNRYTFTTCENKSKAKELVKTHKPLDGKKDDLSGTSDLFS